MERSDNPPAPDHPSCPNAVRIIGPPALEHFRPRSSDPADSWGHRGTQTGFPSVPISSLSFQILPCVLVDYINASFAATAAGRPPLGDLFFAGMARGGSFRRRFATRYRAGRYFARSAPAAGDDYPARSIDCPVVLARSIGLPMESAEAARAAKIVRPLLDDVASSRPACFIHRCRWRLFGTVECRAGRRLFLLIADCTDDPRH